MLLTILAVIGIPAEGLLVVLVATLGKHDGALLRVSRSVRINDRRFRRADRAYVVLLIVLWGEKKDRKQQISITGYGFLLQVLKLLGSVRHWTRPTQCIFALLFYDRSWQAFSGLFTFFFHCQS